MNAHAHAQPSQPALSGEAGRATLKSLAVGRSDVFALDPRIIVRDSGYNVREHDADLEAHIEWLAGSIAARGFMPQHPLTVRMQDGVPHLVVGYSRHLAVMRLLERGVDLRTVPVISEPRYANDADRDVSLITSNSGKPLKPLEQAAVFKRLLGYGWSEAEIAKQCNFSTTHIANMLRLGSASASTQELVRSRAISASDAVGVVRLAGGDPIRESGLAQAAVKERKERKAKGRKAPKAKAVPADPLRGLPAAPPAPSAPFAPDRAVLALRRIIDLLDAGAARADIRAAAERGLGHGMPEGA